VARSPRSRPRERNLNAIDDAIAAIMEDPYSDDDKDFDKYQRWRAFEPKWSKPMFESPSNNPIKYWIALQPKYPNLARFAIDILTIPASSCECERVFSEIGDLLAPRRRKISPQLLAALQCIRTWKRTGAAVAGAVSYAQLTDEQLDQLYELAWWGQNDDGDT
jgi:hypothetical protein